MDKQMPTEWPPIKAVWDAWYAQLPTDLRARLSAHDFKRLGDLFAGVFGVQHFPSIIPPRDHTAGPWRYYPHNGSAFYIHSVSKPLALRIASINYDDGAHSFHEADARLIAAAPDLLDHLQELIDALNKKAVRMDSELIETNEHYGSHNWHDEWVHHARAAISRATT